MKHLGLTTIILVVLMTAMFHSVPVQAQIFLPPAPVYVPASPDYGPKYIDPNKNPNKIKIPEVQKNGNGNTVSTPSTPSTGTSNNEKIDCASCSKSGKCHVCHGKGVNYHGSQWNKCGACNGTGDCYTCGGKGWHY